jgi:hypothetical protein
MVEVSVLAQRILDFLHQRAVKRGHLNVSMSELYKAFEEDASIDAIQRSIRFLSDRDLIAPFSYSLTAKGRRTVALERGKEKSAD